MTALHPPATLAGRYRLGALLGRGGMAQVYRATDAETGGDVAIKVFSTAVSVDALARQRREVAVAESLDNAGVVKLFDQGYVDDAGNQVAEPDDDADLTVFLVSELVDGPTLRARVGQGLLTPDQVAVLGSRLADSLAYLHSVGVVHRDVKPANIFLPGWDDGALAEAKLGDFGVAIMIDDTRVTTEGSVVGTPNYLSPEQVGGELLVTGSDVYSLGLVLIECLSGIQAFPGTGVETALARLHRRPEIPGGTPPWLTSVLTAMTNPNADDRPSAEVVAQRLREREAADGGHTAILPAVALAGEVAEAPAPAPSDAPTLTFIPVQAADAPVEDAAAHRGLRPWMVAAAAVVVLGGGIGAVVESNSGGSPWPPTLPASSTSGAASPTTVPRPSTTPTPTKSAYVAAHKSTPKPPAPKPPHRHHHGGDGG